MIQANALRIGNIIQRGNIESFWEHGVHVGLGKCLMFGDIQPIQLTEEWLLKLGFKYWESSEGIQKDYFIHDELPDYMTYYLPYFNMNIYIKSITIKYVHQLQNFFYAINGSEITIKNKQL